MVRMDGENEFTRYFILNFEGLVGVDVNLLLQCQWHFKESAVIFISFCLHIHYIAKKKILFLI
jgi:hypothetical protein